MEPETVWLVGCCTAGVATGAVVAALLLVLALVVEVGVLVLPGVVLVVRWLVFGVLACAAAVNPAPAPTPPRSSAAR